MCNEDKNRELNEKEIKKQFYWKNEKEAKIFVMKEKQNKRGKKNSKNNYNQIETRENN